MKLTAVMVAARELVPPGEGTGAGFETLIAAASDVTKGS
jgi:hypothetical protein